MQMALMPPLFIRVILKPHRVSRSSGCGAPLAEHKPWGAAPNPALAVGLPGWVEKQPTPAAGSVGRSVSIKPFRGINGASPQAGPLHLFHGGLMLPPLIASIQTRPFADSQLVAA